MRRPAAPLGVANARGQAIMAGLSSRSFDALLIAGDRDLIDHLPLLVDALPRRALRLGERGPELFPVLTSDYEGAGHLAGRRLRGLGHGRVAVVASPAHTVRIAGFRRAFAADGLAVPDTAVLLAPEPTPEGGFAAAPTAQESSPPRPRC
ncbi:hypothetical protein [Streptomyces sp. NPDC088910]|uniref:hypothetical protein n=1 Tax=Streptomyces sp. NPDC088910 TaxID=3365911 RepID=UPI0037F3D4EC